MTRLQTLPLFWTGLFTNNSEYSVMIILQYLVKESNSKECVIKGDNLCVTGPYETMSRFHKKSTRFLGPVIDVIQSQIRTLASVLIICLFCYIWKLSIAVIAREAGR